MSELFLSRAELHRLTGRHTRPAQIKRLREMRIPWEVNALGQVIVLRSAVEHAMGVPSAAPPASEPDFEAIL